MIRLQNAHPAKRPQIAGKPRRCRAYFYKLRFRKLPRFSRLFRENGRRPARSENETPSRKGLHRVKKAENAAVLESPATVPMRHRKHGCHRKNDCQVLQVLSSMQSVTKSLPEIADFATNATTLTREVRIALARAMGYCSGVEVLAVDCASWLRDPVLRAQFLDQRTGGISEHEDSAREAVIRNVCLVVSSVNPHA